MTETTPPQITQKLQIQIWWFTALLIAINVGLFGWQILSGVNITDPSPMDAITWGQILHHSPSMDSPNVCLAVCFSISV